MCYFTLKTQEFSSHLSENKKIAKLSSCDFFQITERMRLYSLAQWCSSRPSGKLLRIYTSQKLLLRKTFVIELKSSHLTSPKIKKIAELSSCDFFQITERMRFELTVGV